MSYGGYSKKGMVPNARKSTGTSWSEETLADVAKLKCREIPDQSISQEDAEYYGIKTSLSTTDGITLEASYYPYYNKAGDLTGYKKRDWTKDKDEDYHFSTVGTVKASSKLFGQNKCAGSGKRLIYVEGEGDVVATRRMILDSLIGTKYEAKMLAGEMNPNVVGLNTGAGNAAECTAHNEKFIRGFNELVLGFDNDQATVHELAKGIKKGKEATEAVAGFLLAKNIYTFEWPVGCKDPREVYEKTEGWRFGRLVTFTNEMYSPEKIVSGDDTTLDELLMPLREGLYLPRYPKLMEKLHGLRIGQELVTLAAFSGVGKSTLAREFAHSVVSAGHKTGFIFLEEPRIKTQQALICLELGVMLPDFRANPLAVATREQIAAAKEKILSNGNTFFLDHFGSLQVHKLMHQISHLHHICGCEHIFLDHVSMVVAGLATSNERKDLDMLYEELAAFVTVNDCTIHAVCHLKRVEENKPRVKDGEEPEPYWREVRKEMLRGSAGIEQMSSTIVVLENQIMPDGQRGLIRTRVEKNREWSALGVCDTMNMLTDGRLHSVNEITGQIIRPEMIIPTGATTTTAIVPKSQQKTEEGDVAPW
ncbi:AAA family ATPase [bacterium]|nr:AAA family ATPase [bacterium]